MQFDIYISMLEKMRDKTRDDLYKNLIDLGIDCELSKEGSELINCKTHGTVKV